MSAPVVQFGQALKQIYCIDCGHMHLCSRPATNTTRRSDRYVDRTDLLAQTARAARDFVLAHPDRRLTLAAVAARLAFSPKGLENALRRESLSWTRIRRDALRWQCKGIEGDLAA